MKKSLALLSAIFVYSSILFSQPGCPNVNAGADVALPCGTNCTNLTATPFQTGNTTAYTVSAIPYTPFSYTAGTPILVNIDDIWSSVINLPFNFCFFGNVYNQVVVGANGLITFDVTEAGASCAWDLTTVGSLPTTNTYTNCIMGPYHDIDPSLGGTIKYQILGSAPCRTFVISYNTVPMYDSDNFLSTCDGMDATHQIVIYETTNVIEVYIAHKDACPDGGFFTSGWNDGLAIEGIQNAAGTVAYTVPGRNNTVWTANNSAHRFTPSGPSNVSVAWFQGATQIGTGNTVNVCPSSASTYTAQATYTNCDNTTVVVTDNVNVTLTGLTVSIPTHTDVSCFGGNNGSATATTTGGVGTITYAWSPSGGNAATANSLPAGTYTVSATNAGCTRTATVTVTQPNQLTVNVPDATINTCPGGSPTTALLSTVTGGTTNYTYAWSNGQSTANATSVGAGSYTLTVTDAHSCTATDGASVSVVSNPIILGTPTILPNTCTSNSGSIALNVSGGSTPLTFSWSNGGSTSTLTNLTSGSYTVTVTDASSCSVSATYTVSQAGGITLNTATITNVSCNGGNNGSITASQTGGSGTISYVWSNGANTATTSNLVVGSYSVTATDQAGCSVSATYAVSQPSAITINSPTITNVSCNGGNNGSINNLSATGGTGFISYTWSNGQTGANATNLVAGSYTVTAKDANNCTATASYTITQPTAITISAPTISNVTCNGGNNGSLANISASGGTGAFTFTWSNGQVGSSATTLVAGTYTVTARDVNNCSSTASYTITQPTAITITAPTISNVSCNGGNNGSLNNISASGGTGVITFTWSNGQVGTSATNLVAGSYTVTAKDANNCTSTASYTITQPTAITIVAPIISNVSCNGGNNGSLTNISTSGGTGIISFTWSNGQTGANATNLLPAIYSVTATDANSCTATASYTISQPTAIAITAPTITNISCNGGSNGSLTNISASGGTGVISFTWNNGQTGVNATNLTIGNYSVTATDANSCTATASYSISQPTAIVITAPTTTNVTCHGGNDGSLTNISASGGTGVITFAWSNGQTGANTTNLVAGTYNVTATDANSCTATASYTISEPTAIIITAPTISNVLCNGGNNGSLTNISASGGTGVITFTWSNGQSGVNATNLIAGTYTVTATDAISCTATASYIVTEPTIIVIGTPIINNVKCFNGNDGNIVINPTGGTGGYTYNWSNGQTTASNFNLTQGSYNVTVTDINFCTATATYSVTQPAAALSIDNATITDAKCFGSNDGIINASVSGGTSPYNYLWSNGTTVNPSTTFTAGVWTLTVTDFNSCTVTASYTVNQPTQLTVTAATSDVQCFGGTDGSATITATGGSSGYSYTWSAVGSGTSSALPANTYTVTVTDVNSCTATVSFSINQPTALVAVINTQPADCFGANTGSATVNTSGGITPYSYSWSNAGTNTSIQNLTAGSYSCTVTDGHSCTVSATAVVTEPTLLTMTSSATNESCFHFNDGTASAVASGGTPVYTYSISLSGSVLESNTTGSFDSLTAGTYTITANDAHGCSVTNTITVIAAPEDVYTYTQDSTSCYGSAFSDGAIHLQGNEVTPPYLYSINGGATQNTLDFYNLTAGDYTVRIQNGNNCITTILATVLEPNPLSVEIIPQDSTIELGSGMYLNAIVSDPNVSYLWSPASGLSCNDCAKPFVTLYNGSTYTLVITTNNGKDNCKDSATVKVKVGKPEPVYIPSAFSPNGDGNNDVFEIYGNDIRDLRLTIYNRWGEKIFDSQNSRLGWDGMYKGQLQNPAVYVYQAEITFLDNSKTVRKGSLTLVR